MITSWTRYFVVVKAANRAKYGPNATEEAYVSSVEEDVVIHSPEEWEMIEEWERESYMDAKKEMVRRGYTSWT